LAVPFSGPGPTAFTALASIYSFNPSFAADLFFSSPFACLVQVPEARSTGSKQTLNGLFIFTTRVFSDTGLFYNFDPALFYPVRLVTRRKFIDGFERTRL
jgi:hypothetical protein